MTVRCARWLVRAFSFGLYKIKNARIEGSRQSKRAHRLGAVFLSYASRDAGWLSLQYVTWPAIAVS